METTNTTSLIADDLRKSKSKALFLEVLELADAHGVDHREAHIFVDVAMSIFAEKFSGSDRSVHGRIFEFVIGEILARNGIAPLYYQAQLRHVPLANFDWLLYHPINPVTISCKTKARERWKQAAYEGLALKRVYPQAINYLVTIEKISKTKDKIKESPQTLDHFVIATDDDFTEVVKSLSRMQFEEAKPAPPIIKGQIVSKTS